MVEENSAGQADATVRMVQTDRPNNHDFYVKRLRALQHFVISKVESLYRQRDDQGRAELARLRRSAIGDKQLWMLIGEDLFGEDLGGIGWDSKLLGKPDDSPDHPNPRFRSALACLQFYALHQQAQQVDVNTKEPWASFGYACSQIGRSHTQKPQKQDNGELASNDLGPQAGVRRRLYAMERSVGFDALLVQMRGLVSMLRSSDDPIRLNYGRLAADLYHLQVPDWKEEVFRNWSHDFYSPHRQESTTKRALPTD